MTTPILDGRGGERVLERLAELDAIRRAMTEPPQPSERGTDERNETAP